MNRMIVWKRKGGKKEIKEKEIKEREEVRDRTFKQTNTFFKNVELFVVPPRDKLRKKNKNKKKREND